MTDWREHIENEPSRPSVRGTEIEVASVLRLLGEGWPIDRLLARFPALTDGDVRACVVYAAEVVERAKIREEMLRRMRDAREHPERMIPHDEAIRRLHGREPGPADVDEE